MNEFVLLAGKIYPLYLVMVMGFIAGRYLNAQRETISTVLIYCVAPVVVFNGVATAERDSAYLLLPVIFFAAACFLAAVFYALASLIWKTGERNLIGFIAGTGNTGYFGIPLIVALYGEKGFPIAVLATLGLIAFENTVGFHLVAKSHVTTKESLLQVARLPALYAFVAGLVINRLDVTLPASLRTMTAAFAGTYTVLGMMVLGIVLAATTKATFDLQFTTVSFLAKFLGFPVLMAALIVMDKAWFHLYGHQIHAIMLTLSVVPMATNTVIYATHLKAHPEKAAVTVALSTVAALIVIPLVTHFLAN
jgi:predicted permease